ncbi:MAG: uracil-DNA glycosylase [Gammaproteobacteria bacterium]|nr:uracil-DNA glycosylase [Gammaproteobacteria bacterium]
MSMSNRRLRYLDAMGITAWVRRKDASTAIPGDDGETPSSAETEVPAAVAVPGPAAAPLPEIRPTPVPETGRGIPDRIAALGWEALAGCVADCQACPELVANRSRTVFGVGNRSAEWLIIGEAPGADEDRLGEPFVGRAGKLLDAMLAAIGLDRSRAYIANILKCRPPNNRDPKPEEAEACLPFLWRQIELIQPRIVLVVGRVAAQTLLRSHEPVGRLRGRVHRLGGDGVPLIVTYHPAYLLRSPQEKRKSWQDLCLAVDVYNETRYRAGPDQARLREEGA